MNWQTLTLADQAIFRKYEKTATQMVADTIFTNLFIWHLFYQTMWTEAHGCLCLVATPKNAEPFGLPPVGGGDRLAALDLTLEFLKEKTAQPVFRRVPAELAEQIKASDRPWECSHDRDNDDYIYLKESMATLGGRRMHQKKNHYNFFVKNNSYEITDLSEDMIPELLAVQENWLLTKERQGALAAAQLNFEMDSVARLLSHLTDFNLFGMAIRIKGRLEGFTVGELMTKEMALVHIEKANYNFRGLFVALASHFCQNLPESVVYVNREQDLGLPGLRHAKESFKPDHMQVKYVVCPAIENG